MLSQDRHRNAFLAGLMLSVLAAAADSAPGPRLGVAELIPRNFPSADPSDWTALYAGLAGTGGFLGVYGGWFHTDARRGEIPDLVTAAYLAATEFDFTPVVALGFHEQDVRSGDLSVTIDWTDSADTQQFIATATDIAAAHQPPFLLIGGEINRVWEQDPPALGAFVDVWPSLYATVKAASPETRAGTGLQLEFMYGGGFLSADDRSPQWQLLDGFRDAVDLIAFSTYPDFDFESPASIPQDYYAEAARRTGVPIAFTELGWPSRPLSTAPDSGHGGSPPEQVAFARRFRELPDGLDVEFALRSFSYDVGSQVSPAFERVALRENAGAAKPVLDVWRSAAAP